MSAVAQLRPYNQSQLGMAFQRTSWGLRGLGDGVDYSALSPAQSAVLGQLMTNAQMPTDAEIASGAILSPGNMGGTGISNGLGMIVVGFIVIMAMGLFESPRKYGR